MGAHCYSNQDNILNPFASFEGGPKRPPFKVWVCKATKSHEIDVVFVRDSDPTKMDWDRYRYSNSTVVGEFNTLAEADACALQHFRFICT